MSCRILKSAVRPRTWYNHHTTTIPEFLKLIFYINTIMNTIPFNIGNWARTPFTVCCIRNRTSLFLTEKVPLQKKRKGTENTSPIRKLTKKFRFTTELRPLDYNHSCSLAIGKKIKVLYTSQVGILNVNINTKACFKPICSNADVFVLCHTVCIQKVHKA